MNTQLELDALVVGGGIAGLWLARRLRHAGHAVAIVEQDALGAGQSLAAQGIIHGGMKYALGGRLEPASDALATAPSRWRACLEGHGEIALTGARRIADETWLWAAGTPVARLTTLLASRVLRGRTERTPADRWPAFLADGGFDGIVYRLDECVVDVASVLHALADPLRGRLLRVPDVAERIDHMKGGYAIELDGATLRAPTLLLAAGAGNAALLERLGAETPLMQRRPLHQVCVDLDGPHAIHGHFLTTPRRGTLRAAEPALTITSHAREGGGTTLYLGGALAGAGVERDRTSQIEHARELLLRAVPGIDLSDARLRTLRIDRAEPRTEGGRRPDGAFVHARDGLFTLWPTKLALAPALADRVLALVPEPSARAEDRDARLVAELAGHEAPGFAPGFEDRAR